MKYLTIVLLFLLLLGCPEVLQDNYAAIFITNNTGTKTTATVDGKSKTIFAFDFEDWDIEWQGMESKSVEISIPTDTIYVDLDDGDIEEYFIN